MKTPTDTNKVPLSLPEVVLKQQNEVARLRELLNRAIQMLTAVTWGDEGRDFDWQKVMKDLEKLAKEAALAPAPEEPLSDWKCPHCVSTAGTWFSRVEPMGDICEDCGKAVDEETLDGVTMEQWYGGFSKIESTEPINPTCDNTTHKFGHLPEESVWENHGLSEPTEPATEWRELGPDEVIQEGEKAPDDLHAWMRIQEEINREVAGELRYLRDEIQKLKQK